MAEQAVVFHRETVKPLNALGFHYFIETNKLKLVSFFADPNYPNKSILSVVHRNYWKDDKPRSFYKLEWLARAHGIEEAFVVDTGRALAELPFRRAKAPGACIVAYEKVEFKSYLEQEQEYAGAFVQQVLFVLKNLKKGGTAVFRVYDMYTPLSAHLYAALSRAFRAVSVEKPPVSLAHKSDRMLVCKEFAGAPADVVALLSSIVKKDDYRVLAVHHPFFEYEEFLPTLQKRNHELNQAQYMEINKMINYLNKGNFYGEDYEEFKRLQGEFNAQYELRA